MRPTAVALSVTVLLLVSCGGQGDDAGDSATAGIEPCSLLTESDLISVLGVAYLGEETEPAGPFIGCSWGGGEVLVQIAASETVITAPGEGDCPTAGIGEGSYACPGRVKFLMNGVHVSVSTISPLVDDDQLLGVARVVELSLQG
ncbi:MAG: hypothetical protein L0Z47_06510 [Actinobacteria bacterium]|nr:hypothetical protein [Actinomycetota bacterium]